ncbi:unnamed protein product [Rhodiola kirilowii]
MGKATRWLKGLFGRFSISGGLCHDPTTNMSPTEAPWLRSYFTETDKEQSKRAIAVAAASADAAVAIVKLTTNAQRNVVFDNCRERCAAVRIQSVFRGFLARKALRALRALVKLQAVVRGFLVRKQAVATLHSMHALIRAQATVRSHRMGSLSNKNSKFSSEFVSRKSLENLETRSVRIRRQSSTFIDQSPKIVEMDTGSRPRSNRFGDSSLSISESLHDCYSLRLPSPYPYVHDSGWGFTMDECKFSTAHSTPRFCAKSEFTLAESNNPSYMGNTQSFRAKVRSQSAPRQRADAGSIRRMSSVEARNSFSEVKTERSCSNAQEVLSSFKNAVMGKLEKNNNVCRR